MKSRLVGREKLPIYIVGILLVLASFFAFQQEAIAAITGKIAGVVKDAETGEALPGANLIIVGTTMGAAADVDGYYYMINIPPGTYSLQARMMGYESVTKTGVIVSVDHTAPLDFELKTTTIKGKGITVKARGEVIKMDLSSSSIVSKGEEITAIPLVTEVGDFLNLLPGVKNMEIRGGGLDQTAFMMDGLVLVDNGVNEPIAMPNISSIKELEMIKGGFNAEYGNVRSGVVNIVTQEGSPSKYHGSIDYRISPPHRKHSGASIFSPDNYFLRPYLDPEVCWEGTTNGTWDKETQSQYPDFMGWDAYSTMILSDDDPTNDMTPSQARDYFIWLHRCEGAAELIPEGYKGRYHEGKYGDKPDWNVDLGFGGPVPVLSKYLGKLSFFTSYRTNWETFTYPTSIIGDYNKDDNFQLKLTSRISSSMKLSIEGLYGKTNSMTEGDFWWPWGGLPFDRYRSMEGLTFDHVLSPSTFYNLRITHINTKNLCIGPTDYRDTTTIRHFGSLAADESPYGYWDAAGYQWYFGMVYGGTGAGDRNWSGVNSTNAKFDLTSQINKYNQIKVGGTVNYDDLNTHTGIISADPTDNYDIKWRAFPIRGGAYLQDKIEFEGMIANLGVRLDYNNPNCDWYTVDRYSKYYGSGYKDVFEEEVPKEPAKGHLKVSPRLGISHPISANAKLYFNYGHFYSMGPSYDMYTFERGVPGWRVVQIGNPSADIPRDVAYELGYEQNIADIFLLHLAGYYKDVTDQTGNIEYENYDGSVHYSTIENNNYQDIRGFELEFDKRFGRWITGWINYDYKVITSGYIGREVYYQDPRKQEIAGLMDPYQERPIAHPILSANIQFAIPEDWGPSLAGIKPFGDFHLIFLYSWESGNWMTWDPLATHKLVNNLQWKNYSNLDARLNKEFTIGGSHISLFVDVVNLLDTKHLTDNGFSGSEDSRKYFYSLHLPMYKGEEYKQAGFVGGNDKPGDIKSDDKPYIDMPNIKVFSFDNLRNVFFGLRISF